MNVQKLEKRQTLYLPDTHDLPEDGNRSVRINVLVLGNIINISAVTSSNVRFKNEYQIVFVWECFKLWF